MDWLKQILEGITDEQMEAVKQALPKHFVPKDQYNKKVDELRLKVEEHTTLQSQLDSNESLLKELKKKAELSDEYKGKLDEQMNAMESFKADADKRLANMQKTSALEKQLLASKAAPDAVDLLLKEFELEKVELDETGSVKGFETLVAPVIEKRKSLFITETTTTPLPKDQNTPPDTELSKLRSAMGL